MIFRNMHVSAEFLTELYDVLRNTKTLLRSDLYDESCSICKENFLIDVWLLILQMEDMMYYEGGDSGEI